MHRAADRQWWIVVAIVAAALVLLTCLDVRRRGRIEPLPAETTAAVHADGRGAPDASDGSDASGGSAGRPVERIFPFGRSTSAHRTDLTAYTAAAKVLSDGGSADEAYRAQSPRGWRYQYPPLFAALLVPMSGLDTRSQALLFGLFTTALIIATLFESRAWWRLLERPPDERASTLPPFIVAGAIAATALPALNTLQRGQVGMLVVLPLMTGFRLLWTARHGAVASLGAGLLAFPAVLKFIPMMPAGISLLMALAALRRGAGEVLARRRAAAAVAGFAAGTLAFAFVVPALVIGPGRTIDATRIFAQGVVANPDFSDDWQFELHAHRNQSLDSAAWKLLRTLSGGERVAADPLGLAAKPEPEEAAGAMPPPLFGTISTALRALLVLAVTITAMRLARDGLRGAFAGLGVACLATLTVSPVSWGHHFTMLLPTMLAVPAWLDARGRSGAAIGVSAALGGAVVVHYLWIDGAGRVGLLGLTCGAVLAALLVITWRQPLLPVTRGPRSHTLRAAPEPSAPPATPRATSS